MKIHSNFRLFAATNFDATKYIASPAFGVNRFMLDRIGNEKARATTIVEYKANSKFPEHTHIGGEEFLVLRGTFKDQFGEFPAGTYVRNPIGSKHAPWVDEDGCTIMVKLLQMAETGEGTQPLHINLETAKQEAGRKVAYGTVAELYHNKQTGELVEMCWIDAGATFSADTKSLNGEELFILSGSFSVSGELSTFAEWGWVRFPAVEEGEMKRVDITAGPNGAQVYRKTGHLTSEALRMEKILINDDETISGE